jgi:hypothetical protein
MQNKPNSRKAKMKLNHYATKDYERISPPSTMEKQSQTNPIKPNFIRRPWYNDLLVDGNSRGRWAFCLCNFCGFLVKIIYSE